MMTPDVFINPPPQSNVFRIAYELNKGAIDWARNFKPKTWEQLLEEAHKTIERGLAKLDISEAARRAPFHRAIADMAAVGLAGQKLEDERRLKWLAGTVDDRLGPLACGVGHRAYLTYGGRRPGGHERAIEKAATFLGPGVSPADVAALVQAVDAAVGQKALDEAYKGAPPQWASIMSAALMVVRNETDRDFLDFSIDEDETERALRNPDPSDGDELNGEWDEAMLAFLASLAKSTPDYSDEWLADRIEEKPAPLA